MATTPSAAAAAASAPKIGIGKSASTEAKVTTKENVVGPQNHRGLGVGGGACSGPPGVMVFDGFQQRSVKRPRPVKSCLACRSKKLKCDRSVPCSQCQKGHRVCRYASDNHAGNISDSSDGEPTSAGERPAQKRLALGSRAAPSPMPATPLVKSLPVDEVAPANGGFRAPSTSSSTPHEACQAGFEDISSRLDRLEQLILASKNDVPASTPKSLPMGFKGNNVSTTDYNDNYLQTLTTPTPATTSNATRDIHSRGSQMNSIDTSNSLIPTLPTTIRNLTVKGNLSIRTRFFGQNSTRVLLNLFDEAQDFMYKADKRESAGELFQHLNRVYSMLQEEQRRLLSPITVFVDSVLPVYKRMADILPKSKAVCDRLLDAYVSTSEGLYRVVHVPSFRAEYKAYWEGQRCSEGFLPQLLCMLSIGSRFETESRGLGHDRSEGVHVPTACALVRAWLDGLRGKQLVDIGTLLAELLLLHAQRMIAPRYQDSWTQLGAIIRMAMTMGLHRDPSEFPQIRPFAAEFRRKLWYSIMDMDLHLSLGCNLPCGVRDGEYTCQPPLNLDDDDLRADMTALPPPKPIDVRTDGQLQAYAASTLPISMRATTLVSRLDTIRDYGEVLEVGTMLERILDDINCVFPRNQNQGLNPSGKYKEWRMRCLLDMHVRRPLLALYRPFALSSGGGVFNDNCPPQITSTYLKSSMVLLTYLDELDARSPAYIDVSHMYYVILKHDIIQAAFSVCYYIRNSYQESSISRGDTPATGGGYATSPASADGGDYLATPGSRYYHGNKPIWSGQRMTRVVEKTLEDLIMMIRDSTSDLKDIVALSAVIKSVQPGGTTEERLERMTFGIRRILDACMSTISSIPGSAKGHHGPDGLIVGSSSLFGKPPPATVDQKPYVLPQASALPPPALHLFGGIGQLATAGFPDELNLWGEPEY
ncbi:hypothetical protein MCOR27_000140 [Pyricularia oryzae]|uniref:Zn(2)-C6 fungal-type domain-containing protein n=1 Tax=Pyricularia grisea TaxID=148305 RepID=A0ABQ8N8F8_PYRGI|nr:hypothetical protein MCOR01_006546 [Pyricularia oryzae]KAI6292952.1 hypothetical protein MCOR33_009463 [Pyricularia grisea]KAI6254171.1 hypothetical protein MCOR19_009297 [Pyricularia oryzae]KAI6269184.1 hypothetical protein MCOR26_008852 [Pyricularia oryzae]KAI6289392.1 hypothetical protein MCOR27_000140 [Pyricularia oryzae]